MRARITIFLSALLASCTVPFEIDTRDSNPVLVIYGVLSDLTDNQYVTVSVSAPYFSDEPDQMVGDAEVWIEPTEGMIIPYLSRPDSPGLYQSAFPFDPVPGRGYTLNVSLDFDGDGIPELYQASTTVITPIPIDSMQIRNVDIMGYMLYGAYLYAQDPPSEDYYLSRFVLNDSLVNNSIIDLATMDDQLFNGQYINGISLQLFSDSRSPSPDNIKREHLKPGDVLTLYLSRIERGYYDFINQCQHQQQGESPFFGGPPSNIVTNLTGGAVGYFAGYSSSSVTREVTE